MGNNNQMNSNGAGEESLMEANQEMHDDPKDVRGIDLERQGILEDDENRINESAKDVKDDPKGDIAQPQPQPPPSPLGPIVCWERFLPVRSLNVLLVENDDSTRQLVSALLRNCSYEVLSSYEEVEKLVKKDGPIESSWTKHAVEDDSPQQMSPSDPWADPYDSTCAQVIHSKHVMPKSTNKGCREQKEVGDKNSLGKDLEKGAPQNPDRERIPYPTEKASSMTDASMERLPQCNPKIEMNENVPGQGSSNASCGPVTQVADLIDGIADNCEARLVSRVPEIPDGFSKISKCKDKANEDSKELPTLELSLKRLRSSGDGDDHNILRHSDLSAFSSYNSPNSQTPRGHGASCSNPHDASEEIKSESTYSTLNAVALKQGSNGSSNNNDMGSTTKDAFTKLPAHKEKITSTATAKSIYPSTLHHTPHRPSANQPPIQEKVDDVAAQAMTGQARGVQHEIQVQHHHHHYHHHHHHVHSMQEQQPLPPPDCDDISLNNMVKTVPRCGSSNMFPESMEINAMNYSLNGSASGRSNGNNGSSKAVKIIKKHHMDAQSVIYAIKN